MRSNTKSSTKRQQRQNGHCQHAASTSSQTAKSRRATKIIVANCGAQAKLILRANPRLASPKAMCQLSRASQERQQFEIGQVEQGKRLFSVKSTVFDTVNFGEVGSRLARAGGFINLATQFFQRGQFWRRAVLRDLAVLKEHVISLRSRCGALYRVIRQRYAGRPAEAVDVAPGFRWGEPKTWDRATLDKLGLRNVQTKLNCADSFIAKCVRDLGDPEILRAKRIWPSRDQTHSCCVRLFAMIQNLHRISEILYADVSAQSEAPQRQSRHRIVATHACPDVDALTAAWLIERYLFVNQRVEVVFLPRSHDVIKLATMDCIVDLAGLHDSP